MKTPLNFREAKRGGDNNYSPEKRTPDQGEASYTREIHAARKVMPGYQTVLLPTLRLAAGELLGPGM
jgi:hypothetical protein